MTKRLSLGHPGLLQERIIVLFKLESLSVKTANIKLTL